MKPTGPPPPTPRVRTICKWFVEVYYAGKWRRLEIPGINEYDAKESARHIYDMLQEVQKETVALFPR